MRSVNKVILVGMIGRDPDIQTTADGSKVAHVSLTTTRRWSDQHGMQERTMWHRLTLRDRLAEVTEDYVRKGDRVYLEGELEYDSFERNGVTIPTSEIRVRELVLLGTSAGGRTYTDDTFTMMDDYED